MQSSRPLTAAADLVGLAKIIRMDHFFTALPFS